MQMRGFIAHVMKHTQIKYSACVVNNDKKTVENACRELSVKMIDLYVSMFHVELITQREYEYLLEFNDYQLSMSIALKGSEV